MSPAKRQQIAAVVDRMRAARTFTPKLPGGLAANHHPSEFPAATLRRGAAVELEHTGSIRLAVEITMGHLVERRDYYKRLPCVEGRRRR